MYKYETHCHTKESSSCGQAPAEQVVEAYLEAGYDGIVITDHFTQSHGQHKFPGLSYPELVDALFAGFRKAQEAARGRIVVLPGFELRFEENDNDYLIYGMRAEHLLAEEDIFSWGIKKFSAYARSMGFVIIQAHPFRNNMRIIDPDLVDFIEINNGHPRQNSRNEIAQHWAHLHNKPGFSGSDFHRLGDQAHGGILLTEKPKTMEELLPLLKQEPLLIMES